MIWHFLHFCLTVLQQLLLGHYYRQEVIFLDSEHHHYRRYSARYKKKRNVVKNFWIVAGIITLLFPLLQVAIIVSMLATFISFTFLDETP